MHWYKQFRKNKPFHKTVEFNHTHINTTLFFAEPQCDKNYILFTFFFSSLFWPRNWKGWLCLVAVAEQHVPLLELELGYLALPLLPSYERQKVCSMFALPAGVICCSFFITRTVLQSRSRTLLQSNFDIMKSTGPRNSFIISSYREASGGCKNI